ncbi:hypothetical protein GX888_03080 [Candidatus Dojkabacteria bacterium]|uniref:Uncharacterized protein n=1 Tax=Candidatus Dojkabacteria bacterium TaxID=2099670 RepID=A0A847VDX1_9BACT|nr:hypothetical protein [Candidatus Dojkabacteria bacterium]
MEKEPYIGRKIDYERYQGTTSEDLISEILEQKLEEPTTKIKEEELYKETVVQSTQQVVSRGIDSKLEKQVQTYNQVWRPVIESKSYRRLESVYHQISPKGVVYFDVLDREIFITQTEKNFQSLIQNHQIGTVKRWNDEEIEKMFGKGLNPTSLITSYESAQWFAKEIPPLGDLVVLELGTGAGWATVMLYESIRGEHQDLKVKQYSVDMSPHAIAATETLLTYKGIPHIVATNPHELAQIQDWMDNTPEGKGYSGVILVLDDINGVLERFSDKSVEGVYSSHGTAYLSKSEYRNFLNTLSSKLKNNGIFIADSLNPLYTNRLDVGTTLSQMLAPKRMMKSLTKKGITYMYGGKLRNNSKYFPGEDVQILKGFNTPQAYLIIEWCNYLLKKMDFKRLVKTVKSLQVTMRVVDEYRSDVFPSFLLKDIVDEEKLNFQSLSNPPEFPIFMDTQGFRMKKKDV